MLPENTSIEKLADIIKNNINSNHERTYKDSHRLSNLLEPTVDLDICALPDQVHDRVLLQQ